VSRGLHLNDHPTVLDWRAAAWLPVYLVGMGLIVFFSDFGPLQNPLFTLGWDMLAVAVFSLAIFYWAMAVALSKEQIEEMISEVVLPEEEGLEVPAH
jgi:hypothetical protein